VEDDLQVSESVARAAKIAPLICSGPAVLALHCRLSPDRSLCNHQVEMSRKVKVVADKKIEEMVGQTFDLIALPGARSYHSTPPPLNKTRKESALPEW